MYVVLFFFPAQAMCPQAEVVCIINICIELTIGFVVLVKKKSVTFQKSPSIFTHNKKKRVTSQKSPSFF